MIQKPKRRDRILASIIDSVMLTPVYILLSVISTFHITILPIVNLIFQALCFWYYVYYQFKHGSTLGKKKFGIRIYSIDNSELALNQCVKRYLIYYVIYILNAVILCFLILNTPGEDFYKLSFSERMGFFYEYNKEYVRPLEYVGYVWLFVNLVLFIFDKQGRTVADYFAGTMVGRKVEDEIDTIGKEVE